MSGKNKYNAKREARIQQLQVKKRAGLLQAVAALVIMVVLIFIKTTFTSMGAPWANTQIANMGIFICALVAAGFAGYGSRKWNLARKELDSLESHRK